MHQLLLPLSSTGFYFGLFCILLCFSHVMFCFSFFSNVLQITIIDFDSDTGKQYR